LTRLDAAMNPSIPPTPDQRFFVGNVGFNSSLRRTVGSSTLKNAEANAVASLLGTPPPPIMMITGSLWDQACHLVFGRQPLNK
jgi:hypothetical protein